MENSCCSLIHPPSSCFLFPHTPLGNLTLSFHYRHSQIFLFSPALFPQLQIPGVCEGTSPLS